MRLVGCQPMYTHEEASSRWSEARDKSSLNAIHQFRRRWNQRTFQWKEAKVRFVQNPYRLSIWATTKHHTFSSLVRMAQKQLSVNLSHAPASINPLSTVSKGILPFIEPDSPRSNSIQPSLKPSSI